jgi:hypothetical protein
MSASAPASFAGAPSENLRLAKLLRLALVADHDGEAIGALHALKRALCSAGLDPHFVANAFLRGAQPDTPSISPDAEGDDDRSLVWFAFHRRDRLTPKEAAFVESLTRWRGTISERQRVWLRDICDELAEVASA